MKISPQVPPKLQVLEEKRLPFEMVYSGSPADSNPKRSLALTKVMEFRDTVIVKIPETGVLQETHPTTRHYAGGFWFGPRGQERYYALRLEMLGEGDDWLSNLSVDSNGNGRFGDDPTYFDSNGNGEIDKGEPHFAWRKDPKDSSRVGGGFFIAFQGKGYQIRAYQALDGEENILKLSPDYCLQHSFTVHAGDGNETKMQVCILNTGVDGDFTAPLRPEPRPEEMTPAPEGVDSKHHAQTMRYLNFGLMRWVDHNRNGKVDMAPRQEVESIIAPFQVDGMTYSLKSISADGKNVIFNVKPAQR